MLYIRCRSACICIGAKRLVYTEPSTLGARGVP